MSYVKYISFKNHYQILPLFFTFFKIPESTLHIGKVDFLQIKYASIILQVSFTVIKIKLSFYLLPHHTKTTRQIVIKNGEGKFEIIWIRFFLRLYSSFKIHRACSNGEP